MHVDSSLAWRLPFALQAALAYGFSVACLALLWESPRWLARAGKPEEAERVWDALGVGAAEREKAEEIPLVPAPDGAAAQVVRSSSSARNAEQSEQRERGVKLHTLMKVFGKGVRSRTLLGVFLMGMQQLSGIDGVLYVSTAHTGASKSRLLTVGTIVRTTPLPTSRPKQFFRLLPCLWRLSNPYVPRHNPCYSLLGPMGAPNLNHNRRLDTYVLHVAHRFSLRVVVSPQRPRVSALGCHCRDISLRGLFLYHVGGGHQGVCQ